MQLLTVTPGFWLVKVNRAPFASLSVRLTVPAENVFPAFAVLPDRAAYVPPPATVHTPSSRTTLSAIFAAVAGVRERRRLARSGRWPVAISPAVASPAGSTSCRAG